MNFTSELVSAALQTYQWRYHWVHIPWRDSLHECKPSRCDLGHIRIHKNFPPADDTRISVDTHSNSYTRPLFSKIDK